MSSASEEGWQERVWGVLQGRSPKPTQRAVSLPRLLRLDVSPLFTFRLSPVIRSSHPAVTESPSCLGQAAEGKGGRNEAGLGRDLHTLP